MELTFIVRVIVLAISLWVISTLRHIEWFEHKQSQIITGKIDEICTPVEDLMAVNHEINPILNLHLLKSDFFRIFKVNLENECPFWDAEGTCLTDKCAVGE
jgi:hypothetical protein